MEITRLALDHFRSWSSLVLDFNPDVTILVGKNGIGKTNIIEGIEFISLGSSHRSTVANNLIQHDQTHATVRVNIRADSDITLEVTIPRKGAVRARQNNEKSGFMRDIVGKVRVIVFSPRDQQLVIGDPAARRVFLDDAAVLLYPEYFQLLHDFKHVGKQRVALLKQLASPDMFSTSKDYVLNELEVWTSRFIDLGIEISDYRSELVTRLNEQFSMIYASLVRSASPAAIVYTPSFEEILEGKTAADEDIRSVRAAISAHFRRLYPGEIARGANLIGPHRDDLQIMLADEPAKDFASNGETWSLAFALKMAVADLFPQENRPIVILDDVFAQLDDDRRAQILNLARNQGQVIITAATRNDIPDMDSATVSDTDDSENETVDSVTIIDVAQLLTDDNGNVEPADAEIRKMVDSLVGRVQVGQTQLNEGTE